MKTEVAKQGLAYEVPALSQSLQAKMACPTLYRVSEIEQAPDHDSQPSLRGTQIHRALASYIAHLVKSRQASDVEMFDALMAGAHASDLDEARDILAGLRESIIIDPERVLAAELRLSLDENLDPVFAPDLYDAKDQLSVGFAGTPDLITMPDITWAVIDDWKSFFAICDADTFQARFYSLLVFQHYPDVQKVTFRLQFVRYGVQREIEFTREKDLPGLKKLALATRARQVAMHLHATAVPDDPEPALPGSHCVYCPLLTNGCPIQASNEYAQQTPEDRLAFSVWARQAMRASDAVLRDFCKGRGPIKYEDANGQAYQAEFAVASSVKFPLVTVLPILDAWERVGGERVHEKLLIGSTELKALAKAKKRAGLRDMLELVKAGTLITKFKVGKAGEESDGE